jgi:hypothetical protein
MMLSVVFFASVLAAAAATSGLSVAVSQGFNISLSVGGKPWLTSSLAKLHTDASWASTKDGTLSAVGPASSSSGKDALGPFMAHEVQWKTKAGSTFSTIVRDYTAGGLPAVVFEQYFGSGAEKTALGPSKESKDLLMSTFPSFQHAMPDSKFGVIEYYDQMVGGMAEGTSVGQWSAMNSAQAIRGGTMGGPLILFDQPGPAKEVASNALVLGSFSNFLSGSCVQDSQNGAINFGMMGSITKVPSNYSSSMMVYYSAHGINAAVEGYGSALLKYYGKQGRQWEGTVSANDVSIQNLGYYTDNGAYYYYNTPDVAGKKQTYESELLSVAATAKTMKIPYAYVLLDSWWYFKGKSGGVTNWTATPGTAVF